MNILNQNSTIITFDQLTTQAEDYYLTSKQALELLLKSSLNNYQINYAALFLLCFLLLVSYFVFSDRRKSKASYYAYRETKLNKAIVNALQSNVPEYNYPWWYNSHLGSIIPFGHDPDLQYERQIFTNYDESCFAVDWYPHKPPTTLTSCNEALKICLFLPGLGLSSRSKFCQKFVESIAKEGYISAVVNASGVEIPLKNSKFWHPGHYHDAKTVLNYIYNNYHRSEDNVKCHVYLVGFSAGSNIIHKLIINNKRKDFLKAALGVCIGGDYVKARMHLESSFAGKLYSYLITYGHKDIITKNEHIHSHIGDSTIKKLLSCKFTSEFDSMAWESLYGLSSETEYYDMISSRYDDSRLNIPYLAIQPQDDPLHQGNARENCHVNDFYSNPNTIYLETYYGNHFGFYEGSIFQAFSNTTSYTYPAKVALEFFNVVQRSDGQTSQGLTLAACCNNVSCEDVFNMEFHRGYSSK